MQVDRICQFTTGIYPSRLGDVFSMNIVILFLLLFLFVCFFLGRGWGVVTGTKSGSQVVKVCDRMIVSTCSAGHNDASSISLFVLNLDKSVNCQEMLPFLQILHTMK